MWISFIELTNYKLFEETTRFDFKPITILTGPNNSGKSSLLQAVISVLCSQQNGKRYMNEFVLNNEYLRLGNFARMVSKGDKRKKIKIAIPVDWRRVSSSITDVISEYIIEYTLACQKSSDEGAEVDKITVYAMSTGQLHKILHFKRINNFESDADFPDDENWDIYHDISFLFSKWKLMNNISDNVLLLEYFDQTGTKILPENIAILSIKEMELFKTYLNGPVFTYNLEHFISNYNDFSNFEILFTLYANNDETKINFISEIKLFDLFATNIELSLFGEHFLKYLYTELVPQIFNIKTSRQYYFSSALTSQVLQNRVINLDEVQLTSLKEAFKNLRFSAYNKSLGLGKELHDFVTKWIIDFEIGEEIKINYIDQSHFTIDIIRNNTQIPLVDLGVGYRNIIGILLVTIATRFVNDGFFKSKLLYSSVPLILEEPEMNLHPKLQSKLADLLIEISEVYKIQLIIETHSEYLIRKMQWHVAKGNFAAGEMLIYYFNSPEGTLGERFKKIEVLENGSLSESFGSGFYDEATNWRFELHKIQSQQNN